MIVASAGDAHAMVFVTLAAIGAAGSVICAVTAIMKTRGERGQEPVEEDEVVYESPRPRGVRRVDF